MTAARNVPLNEIGILINEGEVNQPRFVTDTASAHIPADQKAGEHDRQTIRLLRQDSQQDL